MNTMENDQSKKENGKVKEDWNFDFSEYESEVDDSRDSETAIVKSKGDAAVTGLRSKFSTGEQSLNLMIELKRNIVKFSVEVGSRQADLNTLWRYFALLDELWENIRYTFGTLVGDEMKKIKKKCKSLLDQCESDSTEPPKELFNYLLFWRSRIYKSIQYGGFGYEVERISRNAHQKSKRKIVE